MKKLLYPLSLVLLGMMIFVSCQREAIPTNDDTNAAFQVISDRKLEGAELEAYMAKVRNLPSDQVLDVVPNDLTLDPVPVEPGPDPVPVEKFYCVYSVTGVQGGGCGGLPPVGGFVCFECTGAFPGGSCPNWTGQQFRLWDANGNLICTATITGGAGAACDKCPQGGLTVIHDPRPHPPVVKN